MKEQYYALSLDDYATPSFCSCSKHYFGTLNEISDFMLELSDMLETKLAFKEYIAGNKNAKHTVAYNETQLLTPVVSHNIENYTFNNKEWTHINVYSCPYEMVADKIEIQQIIIHHEKKYLRCIKAKFYNLSYKDVYQDNKLVPIKIFWGFPEIHKTDFSNEKNLP